MTTKLPIVSESSGKEVSWIAITDGQATFGDELAEQLFGKYGSLLNRDDQGTFDALAEGGWSNGYLTIPKTA